MNPDLNSSPVGTDVGTFVRRTAAGAAVVVAVVGITALVVYSFTVLLVIFAGLLLAVFLRTASRFLAEHTRLTPGKALAVVLLTLIGLAGLFGRIAAPRLAEQADELTDQLPRAVNEVLDWAGQYRWGRMLVGQMPDLEETDVDPGEILARVGGVFSRLFTFVGAVLVLLFIGIYVAAEPNPYRRGLLHLIPLRHRERANEVAETVEYGLRWWLLGQFISMLYLGTTTTIMLMLFGVPLALILGVLVAVLTFVPYLGPILGMIPVALLGFAEGTTTGVGVLLVYIAIQSSEGYLVTPMVHRKVVHLPPALTLSSQILLGMLVGPLGFLLATPLLVVVMITIQQTYIRWLGDDAFDRGF